MGFELKNIIILLAIVAWFFVPFKKEKWLPLVGLFLFLSLSTELLGEWLLVGGPGNAIVYNVFVLIDFTITSAVLIRVSPKAKESRRVFMLSSLLLLVPIALFLVKNTPLSHFASSVLLISGLLLTIHSTLVILRLGQYSDELVLKIPAFWIVLSPFFYFASFVPSFGLAMHFATSNRVLSEGLYTITDYLFYLRYLLILTGLILAHKRLKHAQ